MTGEEEIYRHYSTEKAWFVNGGTSARRRNKNGYRWEPENERGREKQ